MSQKQFTTYQADILSFDLREALMGILNSGRYSGYNIMATNGAPSGGNILLKLQHTGGVQKLAKNGIALSPSIGVMVTTQGSVIHEDQEVPITITNNAAGGAIKYSLVYMEHEYTDLTDGSNPASYGVINGTAGGGIPVLTDAYKRSVVGYIEMGIGATDINGCKWHPKPSADLYGDSRIIKLLLGNNSEIDFTDGTIIPADGIIGNRKYTENNYIIDDESITDTIDLLDIAMQDLEDAITGIGDRALDSDLWGQLTDNTNHDATITHHGLLPKLPNDTTKFLNGVGGWSSFAGMLVASNNLSDVPDKAQALINLGVTSLINSKFLDSGWKTMARGSSAETTNFDIKIRRLGSMMIIQGTFQSSSTASFPNSEVASMQAVDLVPEGGIKVGPSVKIWAPAGVQTDGNAQYNRGLFLYVTAPTILDPNIYLRVDSAHGNVTGIKYNINMSFFVDPIV